MSAQYSSCWNALSVSGGALSFVQLWVRAFQMSNIRVFSDLTDCCTWKFIWSTTDAYSPVVVALCNPSQMDLCNQCLFVVFCLTVPSRCFYALVRPGSFGRRTNWHSGLWSSLLSHMLRIVAVAFVIPLLIALFTWIAECLRRVLQLLSADSVRNGDCFVHSRAVIAVGGDLARSPRMQYHAVSCARCGLFSDVQLIGVDEGNKLCNALEQQQAVDAIRCRIDTSTLIPTDAVTRHHSQQHSGTVVTWMFRVFMGIAQRIPVRRARWLVVTAVRILAFVFQFGGAYAAATSLRVEWVPLPPQTGTAPSSPKRASRVSIVLTLPVVIIHQTPPAVPFLPLLKVCRRMSFWTDLASVHVARFTARLAFGKGSSCITICDRIIAEYTRPPRLVTDWHNFGFTLLQVDRRPSFVVQAYRLIEQRFCSGDINVTVSQAMKRALVAKRGHPVASFGFCDAVHVLHDAAPDFFQPSSREALAALVARCTSAVGGGPVRPLSLASAPPWVRSPTSEERGLVIVSSTSWGTDDNYEMVIEALCSVDQELRLHSEKYAIRRLWLVVTGKGPTRESFERLVCAAPLSAAVSVSTEYFQSYADYSTMLGAADVGLSVHFSSCGLDLPMKCVDMLGCGLAVMAVEYDSIAELVNSENGWVFRDSRGLQATILRLLTDNGQREIAQKRQYVREHRNHWEASWDRVVKPLLAS